MASENDGHGSTIDPRVEVVPHENVSEKTTCKTNEYQSYEKRSSSNLGPKH